jgi:hypothetical protein
MISMKLNEKTWWKKTNRENCSYRSARSILIFKRKMRRLVRYKTHYLPSTLIIMLFVNRMKIMKGSSIKN